LNDDNDNIGEVNMTLAIDDEGVVRVMSCDSDKVSLTPNQLARLLTALIKSFTTVGGDDGSTVGVNLN
jgi:hypothetical protein